MPGDPCKRTGYEVKVDWNGDVFSSGIFSRHSTQQVNARSTMGIMTRAVVLAVYYCDEVAPVANVPGAEAEVRRNLLCDVRTFGRISRRMNCVPLLQRIQGAWDEDTYIPRATKGTTDGSTLSTEVPYTPPELMDGDHVLIGFLENDPHQPVILPFTLGHPATHTPARLKQDVVPEYGSGKPPRNRRIRHGGTLIEITEEGNIRIDATEAAKKDLNKGEEVPNNGTTGVIVIKTKDKDGDVVRILMDQNGDASIGGGGGTEWLGLYKSQHQSRLKAQTTVYIDAGATVKIEAPLVQVGTSSQTAQVCGATDAMIKGTTFVTVLSSWMDAVSALLGVNPSAPVNSDPTFQQTTTLAKTGLVTALSLKAKLG